MYIMDSFKRIVGAFLYNNKGRMSNLLFTNLPKSFKERFRHRPSSILNSVYNVKSKHQGPSMFFLFTEKGTEMVITVSFSRFVNTVDRKFYWGSTRNETP